VVTIAGPEAFLHAKLFVDYEELLEKLGTGEKYLLLEGSISESEYVTFPDKLTEKRADITGIIQKHVPNFHLQNLPAVSVCESALSNELDDFIRGIQRIYLSLEAVPSAIVGDLVRGFNYSSFRYKDGNFETLLQDCFLKLKKKVPLIQSFTTKEISFPYGSMSLLVANEVENYFRGGVRKSNLERAIKLFSSLSDEDSQKTVIEEAEEESFTPPPLEEMDPRDISFRVFLLKTSKEKKLSKIRTERAERHHQEILKALAELLKGKGLNLFKNAKIDLAVIQKDKLWIFEIKSTTPKNYSDQVRNAVVQLMENEFLYKKSYATVIKVAVFQHLPPEGSKLFVDDFLAFTKIKRIFFVMASNSFVHLDDIFKNGE
jgi:hypothetical protein